MGPKENRVEELEERIADQAPLESQAAGVPRLLLTGVAMPTTVYCRDNPSFGGACHEYSISGGDMESEEGPFIQTILFQKGPVQEHGVNGIHHEDLLVILIDRLDHFQAGDFYCVENEMALVSLRKSLSNLNARTRERKTRGVEGTNQL